MSNANQESITCPDPGIYPDVTFETYLQWPAANNTALGKIEDQSPAHAKAYMDNPPPATTAFFVGQVFHKLVLERFDFEDSYAVAPEVNRRTKAGKEKWAQFEEDNAGKIVVSQEDSAKCRAMAKAVQHNEVAKRLLLTGEPEICIVWDDLEVGVRCKARLDYLHREHHVIADVKSTVDASERAFARSVANYGYYRQAAFYSDGWKTLTTEWPSFVWVAAEKTAPYGVNTFEADPLTITAGRKAYKRALYVYRDCQRSGQWPSYDQNLTPLSLPRWLLAEEGLTERIAI